MHSTTIAPAAYRAGGGHCKSSQACHTIHVTMRTVLNCQNRFHESTMKQAGVHLHSRLFTRHAFNSVEPGKTCYYSEAVGNVFGVVDSSGKDDQDHHCCLREWIGTGKMMIL